MSFELNYIVWEGKNNSFSPAEKIFDAETLFRKISENEFRSMGFLIVENKECHIKTKKDGRTRCIYVDTRGSVKRHP